MLRRPNEGILRLYSRPTAIHNREQGLDQNEPNQFHVSFTVNECDIQHKVDSSITNSKWQTL
jgi:hypothetical protein